MAKERVKKITKEKEDKKRMIIRRVLERKNRRGEKIESRKGVTMKG